MEMELEQLEVRMFITVDKSKIDMSNEQESVIQMLYDSQNMAPYSVNDVKVLSSIS